MATSSFNQVLTGNGTLNGTLTVADSSGFEVGATVFLVAQGQDVKRLKIQSKPDSTSVVVVNLDNSAFNAIAFTTSANAKLFQPKSSLVFTSGSNSAPFYPKIDSLNKTTAITAPEEAELVLDADVGNSLVIRKNGIEKAAIDSDGVIRHGGAIDSKLYGGVGVIEGLNVGAADTFDIAAGYGYAVVLKNDGSLWGWGDASFGQLGGSDLVWGEYSPEQVSGVSNIIAVAAGRDHSLALKSDGTVWSWGANTNGQLGDGTTTNRSTPVQVSGLTNVTGIAAGGPHSLALKSDGTVWAWGYNVYRQLGDGTTTNRGTPVQVSGLTNVIAVFAGEWHSFALKNDGTVWAWGRNNNGGQLGDGTTTNRGTPVQVSGLTNVIAISAGRTHSLAVKSDGTVWAWGTNSNGQLGDGTTTQRLTPVQVSGLTNVVKIFSRNNYSFALKNDGTVWAWGSNLHGRLLDGTTTNKNTPVQVLSSANSWSIVSPGFAHTSVLKDDGTVLGIGNNTYGQLGDGTGVDSSILVQTSVLSSITTLSCGDNHCLALKSDGTVWAWGRNSSGQVGNGLIRNLYREAPVNINAFNDIIQIAAAGAATVALKSDGTVWVMGDAPLGASGPRISKTFLQIAGLSNVASIYGGGVASAPSFFALKNDGTVWAWGRNDIGQLGDGTTTDRDTPVQSIIQNVTKIAAVNGSQHALFLRSDGTVWGAGTNSQGQLGDGTQVSKSTPVQVSGLTGAIDILATWNSSFAVKSDGTVWAWGRNDIGQLGDGTTTRRFTPVQVSGLTDVVAIYGGGSYESMFAVKSDGTVWVWGGNTLGQLSTGTTTHQPTPIKSNYIKDAKKIVVSNSGSNSTAGFFLLTEKGSVFTWGSNANGQLGTGDTKNRSYPGLVSGYNGVKMVANSQTFGITVALRKDGTVWTWGYNGSINGSGGAYSEVNGQLGDTRTSAAPLTWWPPYKVEALSNVSYVAAGYDARGSHGLAVKSDGTVWSWGANTNGQLGDGTTTDRNTPVQVVGLTGVVAVSTAGSHSLALKSDGTVWSWGANTNGQLGDGTTTNRSTPVQVSGLTGVIQISAGNTHSVALKSDNTVWTWGENSNSQLGDGTQVSKSTPVQVSGLSGVQAVATSYRHTLALKSDGTVWGWGLGVRGELGDGATMDRSTPVQVSGLSNVIAVSAGTAHSLALKSDGTVWGWGLGVRGELGDGSVSYPGHSSGQISLSPVQTAAPKDTVSILATEHSYMIDSSGFIFGCGYNCVTLGTFLTQTEGRDQAFGWYIRTPLRADLGVNCLSLVEEVPNKIAYGGTHLLALKPDGTVWALGDNAFGQLGDGTTTNRSTPVQVSGLSNVIAVSAGYRYSFAIKSDGTVWSWGANTNGQLGDGTTTQRNTPVQVSGLSGVVAVSCSTSFTLALKSNGTVWAWGLGTSGQLGDGTQVSKSTPVQVSGLSGIIQISTGSSHSVALKSDGSVWAWGLNNARQLGDNTTTLRSTPVRVTSHVETSGITGIVRIASGRSSGSHSLALRNDGTVWAWGVGNFGQTGQNHYALATTWPRAVPMAGIATARSIYCGQNSSYVIEHDGKLSMYGIESDGRTGGGNSFDGQGRAVAHSKKIIAYNDINGILNIYSGTYGAALHQKDGNITVIGTAQTTENALGVTHAPGRSSVRLRVGAALPIPNSTNSSKISVGKDFILILKTDGTVWGIGNNGSGQLGNGGSKLQLELVKASGLENVVKTQAGLQHSVALKSDGTVWTWGDNTLGQLGDSGTIYTDGVTNLAALPRTTPAQVSGLTGITEISSSHNHVLALKSDNTVWTWGLNDFGQLGHSSTSYSTAPTQVINFNNVVAVAAGWKHSLAVKSDGTVWAWGYNAYGQLGDGTTTQRNTPVQVSGLTGVIAVAAGRDHSLALKSDGTVWSWGTNTNGQLGDGTTTNRSTPVQVSGLSGVASISAGSSHSMVLKSDGTVWAWGYNRDGRLSIGTVTITPRTSPAQSTLMTRTGTSLLTGVAAAACGVGNSAFIDSSGVTWASGRNNLGQLGQEPPLFGAQFDTHQSYTRGNILEIKNNGVSKLTIDNKGSIIPASDNAQTFGTTDNAFNGIYASDFRDHSGTVRLQLETTGENIYSSGHTAIDSSSIAHKFQTSVPFNYETQRLFTIGNGFFERAYFNNNGKLVMDPGDSTATPGNATVNKPSGRSTVASGSSSVTITNSLVSPTSIVIASLASADGSNCIKCVIPASGSFTIKLKDNAGSNVGVCWVVH